MSRPFSPAARGNLSLFLSALALVVATSGTAYAVANGSIKTKHLANGAVTSVKIRDGNVQGSDLADSSITAPKIGPNAVTGPMVLDGSLGSADLADSSITGGDVLDGSLRLHDLGGGLTNQTATVGTAVSISTGSCIEFRLTLFNPTPNGLDGSMAVGTITTSSGGPVLSNSGFVVPTLVTQTTQGGSRVNLGVCAGSSSQTIPAGSILTWSLISP